MEKDIEKQADKFFDTVPFKTEKVSKSAEAPCYPLPCPFCGRMPRVDESGMISCLTCFGKDNTVVAAPTVEAWNGRGPREFTAEDLSNIFVLVERAVDLSVDNLDAREFFQQLSGKIRLWIGSKNVVFNKTVKKHKLYQNLPCPWCGSEPRIYESGQVHCSNEDCISKASRMTLWQWNSRIKPPGNQRTPSSGPSR